MIHLLINSSCTQEAIEGGGTFLRERAPSTTPTSLLHALLQQTHRRYLTPFPSPQPSDTPVKPGQGRSTKKNQNVAMGTKCGVLGMHRHPRITPRGLQGAGAENRWLIADFILPVVHLWDDQNLKKNLHPQPPPSIIGTSD